VTEIYEKKYCIIKTVSLRVAVAMLPLPRGGLQKFPGQFRLSGPSGPVKAEAFNAF
jgi:hypothetical protein